MNYQAATKKKLEDLTKQLEARNGKVVRVSDTSFEPGDLYCGVWHLFDLIPQGPAGWQPKFNY